VIHEIHELHGDFSVALGCIVAVGPVREQSDSKIVQPPYEKLWAFNMFLTAQPLSMFFATLESAMMERGRLVEALRNDGGLLHMQASDLKEKEA
jgi:hypothetical protein